MPVMTLTLNRLPPAHGNRLSYATRRRFIAFSASTAVLAFPISADAQIAPMAAEWAAYRGLFGAASQGNTVSVREWLARGASPHERDQYNRTPLHVAAYRGHVEAMRALAEGGADVNALERDRYDIVTIAAVANDVPTLGTALAIGCKATNITSRYDGTALIAAAHLGNHESIGLLIKAGAPLDHINNLGWTALIESIVLGDGGERHQRSLALLLAAGADLNIGDRQGTKPIALARSLGYREMVRMLEGAGSARRP